MQVAWHLANLTANPNEEEGSQEYAPTLFRGCKWPAPRQSAKLASWASTRESQGTLLSLVQFQISYVFAVAAAHTLFPLTVPLMCRMAA